MATNHRGVAKSNPTQREHMNYVQKPRKDTAPLCPWSAFPSCCDDQASNGEYAPESRRSCDTEVITGSWCAPVKMDARNIEGNFMDILSNTHGGEPTRPCCKGKRCHHRPETSSVAVMTTPRPQRPAPQRPAPQQPAPQQHAPRQAPVEVPECQLCHGSEAFTRCPYRHRGNLLGPVVPSVAPVIVPAEPTYYIRDAHYTAPRVMRSKVPEPLSAAEPARSRACSSYIPSDQPPAMIPMEEKPVYRLVSCTRAPSACEPSVKASMVESSHPQRSYVMAPRGLTSLPPAPVASCRCREMGPGAMCPACASKGLTMSDAFAYTVQEIPGTLQQAHTMHRSVSPITSAACFVMPSQGGPDMFAQFNDSDRHLGANGAVYISNTRSTVEKTYRDGRVHKEAFVQSSVGDGMLGAHESKQWHSNSQTGQEQASLEWHFNEQGKKMVTKKTTTASPAENYEMYRGLSAEESAGFERHFVEHAMPYLPYHTAFDNETPGAAPFLGGYVAAEPIMNRQREHIAPPRKMRL
eukprot:GEMP01023246.1.p1 GENE.GEMP01023246.1~~GEMP01023246.1.p1  ORF type:complete len:547 (+),score=97.32 GEMP01023246.1:76-1641(+)